MRSANDVPPLRMAYQTKVLCSAFGELVWKARQVRQVVYFPVYLVFTLTSVYSAYSVEQGDYKGDFDFVKPVLVSMAEGLQEQGLFKDSTAFRQWEGFKRVCEISRFAHMGDIGLGLVG